MRRMFSEKQLEQIARKEIQNKELNMHDNIGFDVNKGLVSGDNSIIVNSDNDDIVLDGATTITDDVTLEQDLDVTGDIAATNITGDSIIENMTGYSFNASSFEEINYIYAGACKNGNKITFVLFGTYTKKANDPSVNPTLGEFIVPDEVYEKLYPYSSYNLADIVISYSSSPSEDKVMLPGSVTKRTGNAVRIVAYKVHESGTGKLVAETPYLFRIEVTFLLSENLISE